ncbi:hypothetical protein [Lonsdalea quercina]|uniref:hypothetical protein n=1 Tax=Lonsdalea quercina TaxID=71657 RepID=UPI003F46EE9F
MPPEEQNLSYEDMALMAAAFEGHYSRVLAIVARALSTTKTFSFAPEFLQQENPSYKHRANILTKAHSVMKTIADMLGLNFDADVLDEYIALMHEMANAIDSADKEKLLTVIAHLDKKPFTCQKFTKDCEDNRSTNSEAHDEKIRTDETDETTR